MSCGKRLVTVVVQHGGVDGKDLPSPEMDVVTSRLSYKWAFGRIEQGTAAKEAVNLGIKSGQKLFQLHATSTPSFEDMRKRDPKDTPISQGLANCICIACNGVANAIKLLWTVLDMIGVTAGTIYHRELASDALSVAVTLAKGHQDGRETEEFRIQVSPSKRKKNSKGAPKPAAPARSKRRGMHMRLPRPRRW